MTDTIRAVYETILDRQDNPKPDSYTNKLFNAGIDEIAKKVGEEAVEVIIASQYQSRDRLISELADLTYHCLVLMAQKNLTLDDVAGELERRHKPR